jgi:GT2 family glycosyltransferase
MVLVVIVNKDGHPHVYDCVRSVLKTEYPAYEIAFFDNGSADGSDLAVKQICRQAKNFLLLRSRRAIPLTDATNLVVRVASRQAKYIALLDSDVIVSPEWLGTLIEVMESNSNVGSCQSLLVRADAPDTLDGTGDCIDFLGHALSRHSNTKLNQLNLSRLDTDIFSARSAAMLVRRDLFERCGGLDESFEIGFEDVDLGWRIRLAGFSTRLVKASLVQHGAGSSTGRLSSAYLRYQGTKNRLQMLLKNYEFTNALKYVPLRSALDLLTCAILVLARRPELSVAILRGLAWNITNMRRILARRVFVQVQVRRIGDSQLIGRFIARKLLPNPILALSLLTKSNS